MNGVPSPANGKSGAASRLWASAALLGLLGAAAFGLSLVMPWYGVTIESTAERADYEYIEQRDYFIYGESVRIEEKYAAYPAQSLGQFNGWRANDEPLFLRLYNEVRAILLLGLVSSLALAAGALFLPRGRARYLVLAPCVLMVIAGAAAPMHHQAENPDAMDDDSLLRSWGSGSPRQTYSGENTFGGFHESWGPGGSWYVSFLGAAMGTAASVAVLLPQRSPAGGRAGLGKSLAAMAVALMMAGAFLAYPSVTASQHETERKAFEYLKPEFGDPATHPVFRLMRAQDGDWVLAFMWGPAMPADFVYVRLSAPNSSKVLLDARLTDGKAGNPDFQFMDTNRKGLVDWRDIIIFHATRNGEPNPSVPDGAGVALIKGGYPFTSSRLCLANPQPTTDISRMDNGNWLIVSYTTMTAPASEARIEITDSANNTTTVNSTLGAPNTDDFLFWDNDHDSNFDFGDSILLDSTYLGEPRRNPNVMPGFLARIVWNGLVLAGPLVIPA